MTNTEKLNRLRPRLREAFLADEELAIKMARAHFADKPSSSVDRSLLSFAFGAGVKPSNEWLAAISHIIDACSPDAEVIELRPGGELSNRQARLELLAVVAVGLSGHRFGGKINSGWVRRTLGHNFDLDSSDQQFVNELITVFEELLRARGFNVKKGQS